MSFHNADKYFLNINKLAEGQFVHIRLLYELIDSLLFTAKRDLRNIEIFS